MIYEYVITLEDDLSNKHIAYADKETSIRANESGPITLYLYSHGSILPTGTYLRVRGWHKVKSMTIRTQYKASIAK